MEQVLYAALCALLFSSSFRARTRAEPKRTNEKRAIAPQASSANQAGRSLVAAAAHTLSLSHTHTLCVSDQSIRTRLTLASKAATHTNAQTHTPLGPAAGAALAHETKRRQRRASLLPRPQRASVNLFCCCGQVRLWMCVCVLQPNLCRPSRFLSM